MVVHHLWLGCGVVFGSATPAPSLGEEVGVFSAITRGRFRLGLARNFMSASMERNFLSYSHSLRVEGAKTQQSKKNRWRRQDGPDHSAPCGSVLHSLVC
jgi:hypothetical protein